jgi:hypothetical protein
MDDGVDSIRVLLSGNSIHFDKLHDSTGIFNRVDAFVNQSRNNLSVQEVVLFPVVDPAGDNAGTRRYAIWDKIAEGIGNLRGLDMITVEDANLVGEEEENPVVLDWEILACILRRLRRGIKLCMRGCAGLLWGTESLPAFAEAIHGHAMIIGFSTGSGFPFHCLDTLCSALLTLPALDSVSFNARFGQGPEEEQSLESMLELLQSPILRKVLFESIVFTNTLSAAIARALKERSEIANLYVNSPFPEGGGEAVIARALKTNTTLKCLQIYNRANEAFCEVLTAILLSNSTLQELSFCGSGCCPWLSPLFLSLQVNNGLKKLTISGFDFIDEKLSTAMRLGLGSNSTLEFLNIYAITAHDDTSLWRETAHNDTSLWREALSFLRTNTALKKLDIRFEQNVTKSHVTAIRMEVLAMLRENESLETLAMVSDDTSFEDYLVFVAEIQPNTTLKSLELVTLCVDDDKMKDLIPILKKNYGLEALPRLHHGSGDIRSILQLNGAGRRYLVQDGSSISKGVAVLSRVSSDINSVFLHLLENPRLCDRSAVEMSNITGE